MHNFFLIRTSKHARWAPKEVAEKAGLSRYVLKNSLKEVISSNFNLEVELFLYFLTEKGLKPSKEIRKQQNSF